MFSQHYTTFNYSTPRAMPTGFTDNMWDQSCYHYQQQYPSNYQVTPQHVYYSLENPETCNHEDMQTSESPEYLNQYEEYLNYNILPRHEVISAPDEDQYNGNCIFNDTSAAFMTPIQFSPPVAASLMKPNLHAPMSHRNSNFMGKKHRAQITVVPTPAGSFKAIVKRKRKRTVFTPEQLAALEETFTTLPYITREQRQVLVNRLQVSDKSVKIWFQNRRLKGKRALEQDTEVNDVTQSYAEEMVTPGIFRLDYIQSEIVKKTDEFGYVTLDEGVMGDLADVIDSFLTDDNINKETQQSSPVYEPISPASVSDRSTEEESSSWIPSEPNESLQRLFDLQTMLSL